MSKMNFGVVALVVEEMADRQLAPRQILFATSAFSAIVPRQNINKINTTKVFNPIPLIYFRLFLSLGKKRHIHLENWYISLIFNTDLL